MFLKRWFEELNSRKTSRKGGVSQQGSYCTGSEPVLCIIHSVYFSRCILFTLYCILITLYHIICAVNFMYLIMYFMLFSDKPCSHRSKANVVQQDRNRTFGWWEQGLDCADVYTRNGSVFIAIQTYRVITSSFRGDCQINISRSFFINTNFCFSKKPVVDERPGDRFLEVKWGTAHRNSFLEEGVISLAQSSFRLSQI